MADIRQRRYEGLIAETAYFPGHGGDPIGGYLARPLGAGPYPGIVLIHEAFGLERATKEMVRKFSAAGYACIAPDLYWREGLDDPPDVRAVVQARGGAPDARVVGDLEGSTAALKALPGFNGKIGCIGHCSGGRHTLLFACNTGSLNAAVDCYGGRVVTEERTPAMPMPVIEMVARLGCPLLGLFGESDQNPTPAHVARLEEELKRHGKTYEFKTYPADAGHGFFADYRPSYRQAAAVDGWNLIFNFFRTHLKS